MTHKICRALAIYELELEQKKLQDSLNFGSLGNVSVTLLLEFSFILTLQK